MRAARRRRRASSASTCVDVARGGRPRPRRAASRQPSMIDAWFSSSEHDEHVGAAERGEHAEVGGEPGGEEHRGARSRFQSASAASSSCAPAASPTMRRAAPGAGAPAVDAPSCAAAIDRRVLGEPEVVVRRERHHRPAVGRELALGPGGVEVARRAPLARRRGSRVGLAVGPLAPASRSLTVAATSSSASASACTIAVQLLRRDRERRHEHDDVAERAQQHAALDRAPRTPAGPSAARRPAARARRRPSGRAGAPRAPRERRDAVVEQRRAARRSGRARWRARPTRRAARGGAARPRPRARSRCTSARGRACARRGRGRGTRRTPGPLATVADIGR